MNKSILIVLFCCLGIKIDVIITHEIKRKIMLQGSPNINQLAKVISGALGKYIENILVNDRLGGVPINVAIPPIEAA